MSSLEVSLENWRSFSWDGGLRRLGRTVAARRMTWRTRPAWPPKYGEISSQLSTGWGVMGASGGNSGWLREAFVSACVRLQRYMYNCTSKL